MKTKLIVTVLVAAFSMPVNAQYFNNHGYDSVQQSQRMMEQQMQQLEAQRMHQERMLQQQQQQQTMDRMLQEQQQQNMLNSQRMYRPFGY